MVRSWSRPQKALVESMERRDRAELVFTFASREFPEEWSAAVGVSGHAAPDHWQLSLPHVDDAKITLRRPIQHPYLLYGAEPHALRRHHWDVADADPTFLACSDGWS